MPKEQFRGEMEQQLITQQYEQPEITEIEATVDPARQQELLRWWNLSYDNVGDEQWETQFTPILHYAYFAFKDVQKNGAWDDPRISATSYIDRVLEQVFKDLHKCEARCPKDFRQWCYNEIDKHLAKVAGKSAADKPNRKGVKRFRPVLHGDAYFVNLLDSKGKKHTWKFPADWLKYAKLLWPLYVEESGGKFYLVRKQTVVQPSGKEERVSYRVHKYFVAFKYPHLELADIDSTRALARNGDYLDWTDDNIYLPVTDPVRREISPAQREFEIRRNMIEIRSNINTRNRDPKVVQTTTFDGDLQAQWERELTEGMQTRQCFLAVDENKPKRFRSRVDDVPEASWCAHDDFGGSPPVKSEQPEGEAPDADFDTDGGEEHLAWFESHGSQFDTEHQRELADAALLVRDEDEAAEDNAYLDAELERLATEQPCQ